MTKAKYRDIYRQKRDEIPPDVLADCSRRITDKILAHPIYIKSSVIMAYVSIRSEVRTQDLITAMLTDSKRVCLPVMDGSDLKIVEMTSINDLKPNKFGILEPPNNSARYVTPDLIIVPGIAFSVDGVRIGYGGGYYDRLLSRLNCPSIGICPDICIARQLPHEPHDIRVSYLITERNDITC